VTDSRKSHLENYVTLPLIPLRDVVIFPHMMMPFVVGRDLSIKAVENALLLEKRILLSAQKDASVARPGFEDIYETGVVGSVVQSLKLQNGHIKVLMEGLVRARMLELRSESGYLEALTRILPAEEAESPELDELMKEAISRFETYIKISQKLPGDAIVSAVRIENVGRLADTLAANMILDVGAKQELLETLDPGKRLQLVTDMLGQEIGKHKVDRKIDGRVKRQMEKAQKEYYLNEKLKAIQKELGRGEGKEDEVETYQTRVEEAGMPRDAREKALQELKRLESMPPVSAEATVSRNYLDWLLAVPWKKKTRELRDIDLAEKVLDEDHYGLAKVKERILEFLAVRQLVKKTRGTILCLVGPPGVGKTSLARSVARATGRKFVRLSLGGVRDEAEVRGHRRTYIGAFPGQIIQMMRKAGTRNPVFLLDEVDKMSMDFRGDPSAALLEVLDPEQNNAFLDHYLDTEYDLSLVMFIATANVMHTVPPALRDRMEVLNLSGYTANEKLEIARQFLVVKQLEAHGLTGKGISFPDDGLNRIIDRYTREAGVRNLEREIANILRKIARKVVQAKGESSVAVDADVVRDYLGVPKFRESILEDKSQVGLANGLAWTEVGGEVLTTEATLMTGRGKLSITGKLGEVMQESARAAMSYVRSRAEQLGIDPDFHQHYDVHIHVPEGAIPKDGPSAGITMAIALISALKKTPVRRDVAMTGEITLRGKVLPIGGVKEKLLAAHRAGVKSIILPKDNEQHLQDIPEEVLRELDVTLVETMDEVVDLALVRHAYPNEPVGGDGDDDRPLPLRKERPSSEGPVAH
jgi:ATP-dependent Lon protease